MNFKHNQISIQEEIIEKLVNIEAPNTDPYYYPQNFEFKQANFSMFPNTLMFVKASTKKEVYAEEMYKKLNGNPFNVKIFQDFKDENYNKLYVLMEYLRHSVNLQKILQAEQSEISLLSTLNIVYQLCHIFQFHTIPEYKVSPHYFYLQGETIVKTDLFVGVEAKFFEENDFFRLNFLPKGKMSESTGKDNIVVFFCGIVFYKLLTSKFPNINSEMPYFNENEDDKVPLFLKGLLGKMLNVPNASFIKNLKTILQSFCSELKSIYKELYLYEVSMNEKSEIYGSERMRKLACGLHNFLQNLNSSILLEERVKLNLLLGYFCLFIRHLIVLPISYKESDLNRFLFDWIIIVQEENRAYSTNFKFYFEKAKNLKHNCILTQELINKINFDFDGKSIRKMFVDFHDFLLEKIEEHLFQELKYFFLSEL